MNATTAVSPVLISRKELISSLSARIDEVLRPLLPPGTRCALLDFPNYTNVGDSAIWLGTRTYLRRIGAKVVYACDSATYASDQLVARLDGGTILLTGGGSLGDLWPARQRFREKVIRDFPHTRIIQLPQTIHFKDMSNLARARAIFESHPDLMILVRDRQSLELARNEFRATSALCPDMACALGALVRPIPPRTEILWLSRTDKESSGETAFLTGAGVEKTDWLEERPTPSSRLNDALSRYMTRHPRLLGWTSGLLAQTYDPLARQRLLRGCTLLSRGRIVMTDRLHGHILSLLLGIPHVLLDNNYGKVRNFYDAWTKGCVLTMWADSAPEALKRAKSLIHEIV